MDTMIKKVLVFLHIGLLGLHPDGDDRDRGATAVEYGLMVALIAAAIVIAVGLIGTSLSGIFNNIAGLV